MGKSRYSSPPSQFTSHSQLHFQPLPTLPPSSSSNITTQHHQHNLLQLLPQPSDQSGVPQFKADGGERTPKGGAGNGDHHQILLFNNPSSQVLQSGNNNNNGNNPFNGTTTGINSSSPAFSGANNDHHHHHQHYNNGGAGSKNYHLNSVQLSNNIPSPFITSNNNITTAPATATTATNTMKSGVNTWNKYNNDHHHHHHPQQYHLPTNQQYQYQHQNSNNLNPLSSTYNVHHRSVSRLYNYNDNASTVKYGGTGHGTNHGRGRTPSGYLMPRSVSRSVSRSKRFISKGIKRLTFTKKSRRGSRRDRNSCKRSNTTLTKTRLKELLISNQGIIINYPIKTVIALGISLTLLGVIMSIFSSLGYLLDTGHGSHFNSSSSFGPSSSNASQAFKLTGSGTYIGITVSFGGILAIISAKVPTSSFAIHCNLFFAILTIASTGFMTILTANSVFRDAGNGLSSPIASYEAFTSSQLVNDSLHNYVNEGNNYLVGDNQEQLKSSTSSEGHKLSPGIFLDTFLLIISSLTSLLSFVNCCLTAREACQCYNSTLLLDSKYIDGHNYGYNGDVLNLGLNTLQRRERILKWIIQQSTSTLETSTVSNNDNLDDGTNHGHQEDDSFKYINYNQVNNYYKRLSLPGPSGFSSPTKSRPLSPQLTTNYANNYHHYDYRSKYGNNQEGNNLNSNFNASLQRVLPHLPSKTDTFGDVSKSSGQQMYQVLNVSAISCPPGQRGGILMAPSISMTNLNHDYGVVNKTFNYGMKRSSLAVPTISMSTNGASNANGMFDKYQSTASIVSNRISAYDY